MTAPGGAVDDAGWFGDRAVAVTLGLPATRHAVAAAVARALPHLLVRPGMASVLVESPEPDPGLLARVREALAAAEPFVVDTEGHGADVAVPVSYDGQDLTVVAEMLGLSIEAVVSAHQEQRWSVAMMGFAPGFGYLVPLAPTVVDWNVLARRDRPRERVAAGSVAVAAGMSAIYPTAMPGGWHLIGRSAITLFDATARTSPTLLHPGDLVHFVAVDG